MKSLIVLVGIFYFASDIRQSVAHLNHRRRGSSSCADLYSAIETAYNKSEAVRCTVSLFSKETFGADLTNLNLIKEIACLATENAGSIDELFDAFDREGIIDILAEVAYLVGATQASGYVNFLRAVPVYRDVLECSIEEGIDMSGPGNPGRDFPEALRTIDPAVFTKLADVIDELDLFTPDKDRQRAANTFLNFFRWGYTYSEVYFASGQCECSAITSPEQRCSLLQEAAAPIMEAVATDMQLQMMIQGAMMMFTAKTGVTLMTDFRADAPKFLCKLSELQDASDVRGLLDDLGLTRTLFKYGFEYFARTLSVASITDQNEWVIREYENCQNNDGNNDYSYSWCPPEKNYWRAKAGIIVAEAFEASPLYSLVNKEGSSAGYPSY